MSDLTLEGNGPAIKKTEKPFLILLSSFKVHEKSNQKDFSHFQHSVRLPAIQMCNSSPVGQEIYANALLCVHIEFFV